MPSLSLTAIQQKTLQAHVAADQGRQRRIQPLVNSPNFVQGLETFLGQALDEAIKAGVSQAVANNSDEVTILVGLPALAEKLHADPRAGLVPVCTPADLLYLMREMLHENGIESDQLGVSLKIPLSPLYTALEAQQKVAADLQGGAQGSEIPTDILGALGILSGAPDDVIRRLGAGQLDTWISMLQNAEVKRPGGPRAPVAAAFSARIAALRTAASQGGNAPATP